MLRLSTTERLLVGPLAMLLIVLWFSFRKETHFSNTAPREAEWVDYGAPPVVRMELLESKVADLNPSSRDLFSYYRPDKPPRSWRPPPQPPQRAPTVQASVPASSIAQPPGASGPPSPSFSYVGFLGPKSHLIAVFTRDREVFVAQVGDIIDDQFALLRLWHDKVVLRRLGGRFDGTIIELSRTPS